MAKTFPARPTGNRLLNLLPAEEREALQMHLRTVEVKQGQVLYEVHSSIKEIYFPVNCVLSAVTVMLDGSAIEVATVGNEGMSGLPAFSAVTTSPHRVFCQVAGSAMKTEAAALLRANGKLGKLRETITKYQQAFVFQVSQSVACNGLHVIVERCCRWRGFAACRSGGQFAARRATALLGALLQLIRSNVREGQSAFAFEKIRDAARLLAIVRLGIAEFLCRGKHV